MADNEALAAEWARLNQMADYYKALADEKKAELRATLPVGEHDEGSFTIKVAPNKRFNPAKAKAILSIDDFNMVSERVAVGARAKILFPEKYDDMLNEYDNKVTITPNNKED